MSLSDDSGHGVARKLLLLVLVTSPHEIPPEFDDLPEPGRAKAFEFFEELLSAGTGQREAIEQAQERAQHWLAERARSPSSA